MPGSAIRRKTLWALDQAAGEKPTFAFVLAGYGDAWAAAELARALGHGHALVALQPPDDDAEFAAVATATDLAALYIRHLRALRPHGPYFLGGYSAGALFALEMARQLRDDGHEVALLVLFDPLFLRYSLPARAGYRLMARAVELLKPVAGRLRPFKILSAMIADAGLDRHLRALVHHEPRPYDGPVTLLEGRWSAVLRPPGCMAGFRRIARGGLHRQLLAGTHHGIMRPPHVGVVGMQISEWMSRAAGDRAHAQ